MIHGVWLVGLALLSLAVYALAFTLRGRVWSTRATPRDLFRVGTGVAFSAWVDPSLGILAALAGWYWLEGGWEYAGGGTFWPVVAAGILLGITAPPWAIAAMVAALLAAGVLQSLLGVGQFFNLPIFRHPDMIHGTIGHRTGYGIFLAVLMPLGFLTDYGWWLAGIMAVGLLLSLSSVAAGAMLVGMMIILPSFWPLAVALAVTGVLLRAVEFRRAWAPGLRLWPLRVWAKGRHVRESWHARVRILQVALWHCRQWPHWALGHGPERFPRDARTWVAESALKEHYREAHNDYVEFFYDYGAVGIIAVALWVWHWGQGLALGDPVTGSVAAFGTAMLANFPIRVAPLGVVALLLAIILMRRGAWAS